jgi:hypothetical protein
MHVREPTASLVSAAPVAYDVFDVLHLDGTSTMQLPYTERRQLLTSLDLADATTRTPDNFVDVDPVEVMATAGRRGLEGIVAQRLTSPYRPGRREFPRFVEFLIMAPRPWRKIRSSTEEVPRRARAACGAVVSRVGPEAGIGSWRVSWVCITRRSGTGSGSPRLTGVSGMTGRRRRWPRRTAGCARRSLAPDSPVMRAEQLHQWVCDAARTF